MGRDKVEANKNLEKKNEANIQSSWPNISLVNKVFIIESVRGGHVGGVNNKNIFAWELNFFPKENSFIVLLLQHGRRAHTL